MATARELGLGTDQARNLTVIREHNLAVQPDADWFREMGEVFQESDGSRMRVGKFVAIRSVVLVAPFPRAILHREIRDARTDLDEVIEQELELARQENTDILTIPYDPFSRPVTDAGFFMYNRMGGLESVMLSGESTDYGRGDAETRQKTVGYLHAALMAGNISARTLEP